MSAIVAIGEGQRITGYRLAGVEVRPAKDAVDCLAAWRILPDDVGLVLLTPSAHAALERVLDERPLLLWTTLPD